MTRLSPCIMAAAKPELSPSLAFVLLLLAVQVSNQLLLGYLILPLCPGAPPCPAA